MNYNDRMLLLSVVANLRDAEEALESARKAVRKARQSWIAMLDETDGTFTMPANHAHGRAVLLELEAAIPGTSRAELLDLAAGLRGIVIP